MYVYWVESSVIYCHRVLIAVSRMWAVIHPISYPNRHSKRLARGLFIGVWVGVHAFMLPFWTRCTTDDLSPTNGSCAWRTPASSSPTPSSVS
ncbi:hypothetical protein BV898_17090 [Hypsibius exemplaris]|uniref:G-protein coupled receptors family 1 profile domain-containing protein n=1 Tax=Hypsibius exemplaris TaxID=2072580 RepID=A0A9X6NH31_HYPEX|nr:hypothetical protein BV898_17090 [Hypsibius exemplaris]